MAQGAWAVEASGRPFERAKTHLAHFVDSEKLGGGEWLLLSIEFGRCDCDRADAIDLFLYLTGDDASWTVRFRIAPLDADGCFPVELRRRFT